MRNDIYVTLLHGEFDRGKKKTPKNVEVIVSVQDNDGNPMEVGVRGHQREPHGVRGQGSAQGTPWR